MRSCVVLLVSVAPLALVACEQAKPPPEPPAAPLVIGRSPAGAGAVASEAAAAPDEPPSGTTPLAVPARDPRLAHATQRARAVVIAELQSLEALYAATLASSPDRPALAHRLADTYAELGRIAEGTVVARNAHRSAARYYEIVSKDDPVFTERDLGAYYVALEHELEGDRPNARRAYYELIKQFPGSAMIPFAYFAFGEMFFAESEADPSKEQLAEQAYREVLKFPPARNALYVEAQRRLAEITMRRKAGGATRP